MLDKDIIACKVNHIFNFLETLTFDSEQIDKSIVLIDEFSELITSKILLIEESLNLSPNNKVELLQLKEYFINNKENIEKKYLNCLIKKIENLPSEEKNDKASVLANKLKNYINLKLKIIRDKLSDYSLEIEERHRLLTIKNDLEDKKYALIAWIFVYSRNPNLVSDKVDLYLDDYEEFHYLICNHNTKNPLGYINYLGEVSYKTSFGNISYYIRDNYRGNNYALSALHLMTDYLYKQGIKEVYIATTKDNIPSNKIAMKFGGNKIPSSHKDIVTYKCDLSSIKNKRK